MGDVLRVLSVSVPSTPPTRSTRTAVRVVVRTTAGDVLCRVRPYGRTWAEHTSGLSVSLDCDASVGVLAVHPAATVQIVVTYAVASAVREEAREWWE